MLISRDYGRRKEHPNKCNSSDITYFLSSCPRDPSVQFHNSSDPTKTRFSFEAFQFLGDHDYVFIHCRVYVCDVNDSNSRCAKGCLPGAGGNAAAQEDQSARTAKKRAKKPLAQPNEHVKKVIAPVSDKATKLQAAAKKLAAKPAAKNVKVLANQPSVSEKKVQDHAQEEKANEEKALEERSVETAKHRVMRRAAERSRKRGVLGSADLSSKGPFILDIDDRKKTKREHRPKKMFAHAKRSGINRDVKEKNKRKLLCVFIAATRIE